MMYEVTRLLPDLGPDFVNTVQILNFKSLSIDYIKILYMLNIKHMHSVCKIKSLK